MLTYRVHLYSGSGKAIELFDFKCQTDAGACAAVERHMQPGQTAKLWRAGHLLHEVSRQAGACPPPAAAS